MFCWGGNQFYPQVQSLGLKSKASPFLSECGREPSCLLRLRTGSRSVSGSVLLSWPPGKGPGRPKDSSHTQAGPLVQGKSLEIKVKAPRCCPKTPASARRLARLQPEKEEEVVQVSHKTLSFHGGGGSGCSLMSWTTTPDHILFIKLSLTRGNGRLRFSHLVPLLAQTKPCQRILGIVQNYKI